MTLDCRPGTVGWTRIAQVGWDGGWDGMRCRILHSSALRTLLSSSIKWCVFSNPYLSHLISLSSAFNMDNHSSPRNSSLSPLSNLHHLPGNSSLNSFNGSLYPRHVHAGLPSAPSLNFPPCVVTVIISSYIYDLLSAKEKVYLPPPNWIKSSVRTKAIFWSSGSPIFSSKPDHDRGSLNVGVKT